jgi:hypothetical protein
VASADVKAFFESQGGTPGGTRSDAFAQAGGRHHEELGAGAERAKVEKQ